MPSDADTSMNKTFLFWILSAGLLLAGACNKMDNLADLPDPADATQQKINFDVLVTREGKVVTKAGSGVMTKSGNEAYEEGTQQAMLDPDIPYGLIGIDPERHELIINNAKIFQDASGKSSGSFDNYLWSSANKINFSAYYPHVNKVEYASDLTNYSIPYTVQETEAGPLVSKTVEKAINQLNMVPLVFQHITNDIGYKICDATPKPELQGLIHLRKLTATNVASAGVYINDMENDSGTWQRQGYYRKVVVFEGDAKVGVGSENEKFVGFSTLEDRMMNSHRYYSIPDTIEIGKQCVEVIYDVEGFELGGFYYQPLTGQVAKYMLYGLLPNNEFVYGKQYTFHIGLDLSSVYREITFTASVGDWETKIYENNDTF